METTATATPVEEFDPLDDPQVSATYNSIRQRSGQLAADRYLLTVTPAGGMTAKTPTVVTIDRSQAQKRVAPQLSEPLPSSRSLHGSDAVANALLPGDKAAKVAETEAVPAPTTAVAQTVKAPTLAANPDGLADTSTVAVTRPAQALEAASSVTAVTRDNKPQRERKPARSTAAVKQAFETALASFIEADKPFKRSHVMKAAGLGASFYDTYPSLKARVDEAIANVGKPKPQPQPEVEPMPSTVNEPSTTAPPVEAETPARDEPVESETALTATAAVATEAMDDTAGQLATTDSTTLSSNHRPVAGLTWDNLGGLAAHWRDEQERLQKQVSRLLVQIETAAENAEAYERVLQLHLPQATGETHGQ